MSVVYDLTKGIILGGVSKMNRKAQLILLDKLLRYVFEDDLGAASQ